MDQDLIDFGKKALNEAIRRREMDQEKRDKLDELLEAHRNLAAALKITKAQESKLRIEIADMFKAEGYNTIGTHNLNFCGMDIKMVLKVNTKIDAEILGDIIEDLTDEELACIRYKPELKMKEYNALEIEQNEDDAYLDDAITTSDAMPTLTVTLSEA